MFNHLIEWRSGLNPRRSCINHSRRLYLGIDAIRLHITKLRYSVYNSVGSKNPNDHSYPIGRKAYIHTGECGRARAYCSLTSCTVIVARSSMSQAHCIMKSSRRYSSTNSASSRGSSVKTMLCSEGSPRLLGNVRRKGLTAVTIVPLDE